LRTLRTLLAACLWVGTLSFSSQASAQATPSAAASATAGPTVVRYGVLASFPPFQVWPEGNRPGGADVELLRDLAQRAGLVLQPVRYTRYEALEADLAAGRIELASSMARTAERERVLRFSPPYIQVPLALVTRADQPSGALLPDLAGRSIAVVRGYASQDQADRLFPLASRVVVGSLREGLEAVRSGRADTLLETAPVLADLIEREQIPGLAIVRRIDAPSGRLHLALPMAQAALAARLGAALSQVSAERIDSLVQAWSAPTALVMPGTLALADTERAALAAWRAPVIGVVGQDAPFASRSASGQAEGLTVDLVRAVLARLGVQPGGFVFLDAADLPRALLDGRVDLVLGADEAADRTPLLRFVGPFIEYPTVLIGRPDGGAFDIEQLQGRRLALTPNSAARPLVDSRHPGVTVVDCADTDACVDAVAEGRADATLADVVSAALALAKAPRATVQMIGAEPRLRRFHSLALADRHAAIVPAFKRALDLTQQLDLPALKTRWLSRPTPRDVLGAAVRRYAPWGAGAMLLLAALWLLHVRRLHAEVRRTRLAQAEAERSSTANRRFTAFLAHEVRNSLHGVIAGTELARLPGHAGPAEREALNTLLADSARTTLHLLNSLIDRERLHAGRLVLHPEPVRLMPLVQAVVDELAPAARLRGLPLRLAPSAVPPADTAAAGPLLMLDGLRLQQVLRNLLANAIKYGVSGAIDVEARLLGQGHEMQLDIEVRDRGPGIPADERAALFEPLHGAPGVASSAGLGLPLCRDLARLMGGTLSVLPRDGGGTVARLQMPVRRADGEHATEAATGVTGALQVLVIEDAEPYGLLLVRAFQLSGHRALTVGTLAAARQALLAARWDLVLSDVNLPDGDLQQLLQSLPGPAAGRVAPRICAMSADIDTAPPALLALLQGQPLLAKTDDVRVLADRALRGLDAGPARLGGGPGAASGALRAELEHRD